MKLPGLLSRNTVQLPGVSGVARADRRADVVLRKLRPGDIAVLNAIDLDRQTAEAIVAAQAAAVVNAAPSISGRFPNLGPEILIAAGITVVDGVGGELLRVVRDGSKLRLHEGVLYSGEKELARGTEQTPESVADQMIQARSGMAAQLEAFSANTIEFLRTERTLILDGVGVPRVRVVMEGMHVLVVAAGPEHTEDLAALKAYIRDHRPVLVGVDGGAQALLKAGHRPSLVVGDPRGMDEATLKCGAQFVVPADADGHAPGLERIQDLGIGAVAFPASANAEDLALLLAHEHGAALVIAVGARAGLTEFLDRGRSGSNPSTFLTRLKLGGTLVDGKAVAALHRHRVSAGAVALLLVAALVAVVVALAFSGVGGNYLDLAGDLWNDLVAWVRNLF
ncbi:MAG TPA: putative cytokinetic ring protein SteA [Pseudonocardiaceae bacterium]